MYCFDAQGQPSVRPIHMYVGWKNATLLAHNYAVARFAFAGDNHRGLTEGYTARRSNDGNTISESDTIQECFQLAVEMAIPRTCTNSGNAQYRHIAPSERLKFHSAPRPPRDLR